MTATRTQNNLCHQSEQVLGRTMLVFIEYKDIFAEEDHLQGERL